MELLYSVLWVAPLAAAAAVVPYLLGMLTERLFGTGSLYLHYDSRRRARRPHDTPAPSRPLAPTVLVRRPRP